MADRSYNTRGDADRIAIIDLYDRQLAAAEAWDFEAYDTTFAADATVDLRDFGQAACPYPEYRSWLSSLQPVMVHAQRVTGGLRLALDGDGATTRVPVVCYVTMVIEGSAAAARRASSTTTPWPTPDGWRIVERYEELSFSGPTRHRRVAP